MKGVRKGLVSASLLMASACGHGAGAAMRDALSENPAQFNGPVGAPPVDPAALGIAPTGVPPTHAPAMSPEPIVPKVDEAHGKRRMPSGVEEPSEDAPLDKPPEETP